MARNVLAPGPGVHFTLHWTPDPNPTAAPCNNNTMDFFCEYTSISNGEDQNDHMKHRKNDNDGDGELNTHMTHRSNDDDIFGDSGSYDEFDDDGHSNKVGVKTAKSTNNTKVDNDHVDEVEVVAVLNKDKDATLSSNQIRTPTPSARKTDSHAHGITPSPPTHRPMWRGRWTGLKYDYNDIRKCIPHLCNGLTDDEYELAAIVNDLSLAGLHPSASEEKDTNITLIAREIKKDASEVREMFRVVSQFEEKGFQRATHIDDKDKKLILLYAQCKKKQFEKEFGSLVPSL